MDFYLEADKAVRKVLSAPFKLSLGKQLSQEISLPDFYEDLARIIDCSAKTLVTESEISDGVLSVSGEASYSILYYSDKDTVLHRFCFEQEFEAKWDVDASTQLLDITLSCREPSVRIYGTRKLTVSMDCDFSVYLCNSQSLVLPDVENVEIMQKQTKVFTYEVLESEKSRFTEDFIIPSEYPPIEELIYWELMQGATKTQQRSDGLIISSDAQLSLIYTAADGEYVSYKTALPLTKLIKAAETDLVSSELFVCSPKCAVISDSNGENRHLALDFELFAKALVFTSDEITYVCDAYCTDCKSTLETTEISAGKTNGIFEKEFTVKDFIENDGEIKELLALRTTPELSKTRRDGEMLYGEGVCSCNLLVKTESGGMSAYEHDITFDVSVKLAENAETTVIKLTADKVNFKNKDGGFELEIDVVASINAFSQSNIECVTQIVKSERETLDKECSMLIYYPDKDETLWDIGKKHKASTQQIAKINMLDSEQLKNKKFILIPKK